MSAKKTSAFPRTKDCPIVGIMAVMTDHKRYGAYALPSSYVKSVQASGARVVPIFPGKDEASYRHMFSCLNGLLVPGGSGSATGYQKPVTSVVKLFVKWCTEAYKDPVRPVYWPIWGTCLGLEILAVIEAGGVDCLTECKCRPQSYPLIPTAYYEQSRLIKNLTADLREALITESVCPHVHAYCLPIENFTRYNMSNRYSIIGTRKDDSGLEYVVLIEALQYPIYAIMSHQEKANLQWSTKYSFNRSPKAIQLSQAFMNFFVAECGRNLHKFSSEQEEAGALIENYKPLYFPAANSSVGECYYFSG